VGRALAPVALIDPRGAPVAMTFAGQAPATLVLVISGSCPHCENTIPVWGVQIGRASNARLRIICIQVDAPAPEFFAKLEQPWPLYGTVKDKAGWLRDVPVVPAAFLVDARGEITHTWLGEMTEKQQEDFMFALLGAGIGDVPAAGG
jgi:hypothetical protein